MLDERSICWLLAGGTRDDPPDLRRMEHVRALREAAGEPPVSSVAGVVRSRWHSLLIRFVARRALAIPGDSIDCCGMA